MGRSCAGALGIRRDPLPSRFEPPNEATIRWVMERIDAGAFESAFESAVGPWLGAGLDALVRTYH
jgi:hypothetical protein